MFFSCGAALKPSWPPAAGSFGQGSLFGYPNFFFLDHHQSLSKFLRTLLGTDQINSDQKSLLNAPFLSIKILLKLKFPRLRPGQNEGAFIAPSNLLADVIGCNSCAPSWCNWV